MQRKLKNRLNTMDAVTRFCQDNPLVIALIAALGTAVTALKVKVQSIRVTEALQESNKKGVTISKSEAKENMVTLGGGVAAAGQAFATREQNATLYEELQYPFATLLNGNANVAIAKSKEVHDLVKAIPLAERKPFGLDDDVMVLFFDSITEFEDDISNTRIVKADKHKYTVQLSTQVKEGMIIMRRDLLKVAQQLKTSQPEFCNGLKVVSRVINPETHTKLRIEAFDDVTLKPLSKVKVTIAETGETAVTNSKGLCSIYMAFGDYTVILEKDRYIKMTLAQKVKKGSNTVHVDMSPEFVVPTASIVETEKVTVEK